MKSDNYKVMIVDDDKHFLTFMDNMLSSSLPECDVIAISNPHEAYNVAIQQNIDGILLDFIMPEINGVDLCKKIKSHPQGCKIPIVLITGGNLSPEKLSIGLDAGAMDFISKPISNIELISKIKVMAHIKKTEAQLFEVNKRLQLQLGSQTKKLIASEANTKNILSSIPDSVFMMDRDFNIIWNNSVGAQTIPNLISGSKCNMTLCNNYTSVEKCAAHMTLEDGKSHDQEIEINNNGIIKYFWVTTTPSEIDENGSPKYVIIVLRDITRRIHREETLKLTQTLVDNAYNEFYIVDYETGSLLSANKAACNNHQYSHEELLKMKAFDVKINIVDKCSFDDIKNMIEEAESMILETKMRRQDGSFYPAEIYLKYFKYKHKEYLIVSARDLTMQKEIEKEQERIFENETIISNILNLSVKKYSLHDILDHSLRLITSSQSFSFENKGSVFLVDNTNNTLVMEVCSNLSKHLQETCKTVSAGYCLCGRAYESGKIIFADKLDDRHDVAYPGIHEHGHYCVPIKSGHNILGVLNLYVKSGHKKNEKEIEFLNIIAELLANIIVHHQIEEEHRKLSHAVNQSPSVVVICDTEGNIEYVNPKFTELTGYTYAEVVGKQIDLLNTSEISLSFYKQVWKTVESGKAWQGEFRSRKKSGEYYWESSLFSPIFNENGKVLYVINMKEDITERIEAQEKLKETVKNLEKMNEQLKANQNKLIQSEKMASIGQLAAGVAHEINNPVGFVTSNLSTLDGYINTLTKLLSHFDKLDQAYKEGNNKNCQDLAEKINQLKNDEDIEFVLDDLNLLLEESKSGMERIRDIVQNLKTFARVDDKELKEADINEGIESTIKVVWNELKYKCNVIKKLNPIPRIRCYPGQLNQVFANLLVNAAHAIEEKGDITIETNSDNKNIIIKISDTGTGILQENISKLFDPFFTTKEAGKGTGLGLAISFDIIEKHKGTLSVESEVGKGTTFTIELPTNNNKPINGDN